MRSRWGEAAASLLVVSCAVPVATDIDQSQADRVVAVLQQQGVSASKAASGTPDRFLVEVPRAETAAALNALVDQRLLTANSDPDTLEPNSLEPNALVQSRDAERAQLAATIAQQLEKTLLSLEEVTAARVHIALPQHSPVAEDQPARASALVRHRGTSTPLSDSQIQQLIQGAVPELGIEQIRVVQLGPPPTTKIEPLSLAHFGPITVTQSSASTLRLFFLGLLALNLLLLAALTWTWSRWRALRGFAHAPDRASPPAREQTIVSSEAP